MEQITATLKARQRGFFNWGILILVLASFVAACIFLINAFLTPFSQANMAEIRDTWTYYSENDQNTTFKSLYVKRINSIEPNETMVMERTMVKQVANPTLLVQGNHQWIAVYLDQELLYSYAMEDTAPVNGKNPGSVLTEIQLPKDYVGRQLIIKVRSPYKNYSGLPARVYVGDANSFLAFVLSSSLPQILIALFAGAIGLTLVIYILRKLILQKQLDLEVLLLLCFAITISLEAVAGDLVSGLIFAPLVNSNLATLVGALTPIFLISFYCLKMKNFRHYYQKWVTFHILAASSILLFALLSPVDLPEVKVYIDTLNVFGTLTTSLAAIAEAHSNNRFYVYCTPWIVLVALAHCFLYISSIVGSNYQLINTSGIFFTAILLVIYSHFVLEHLLNSEKAKQEKNVLALKTSLLEENRQRLNDQLEEATALRQEFKQNLLIMKDLAEDKNWSGVEEYMGILLQDAENLATIQKYSEHNLTNLILSRYHRLAQNRNIQLNCDLRLPKELTISDDDLLTLMGHTLDRAFRETYHLSDPFKRKVDLTMDAMANGLKITCQHSCQTEENTFSKGITPDLPEQSSKDMAALEQLVKKYRGKLQKSHTLATKILEINLN